VQVMNSKDIPSVLFQVVKRSLIISLEERWPSPRLRLQDEMKRVLKAPVTHNVM